MPEWKSLLVNSLDLLTKLFTALIALATLGIKVKELARKEKEAPHRPIRKGH